MPYIYKIFNLLLSNSKKLGGLVLYRTSYFNVYYIQHKSNLTELVISYLTQPMSDFCDVSEMEAQAYVEIAENICFTVV
jgi:hypothetical protein